MVKVRFGKSDYLYGNITFCFRNHMHVKLQAARRGTLTLVL